MTNQEIAKLDEILQKHDYDPTLLIAIMQDIQKEYHYLPQEALCYIAKKLKLSEAKIYGVATFYENFSLEPKGKYVIKICDGTACHVRKSVPILEEFRKVLGVRKAHYRGYAFYSRDSILSWCLWTGTGMYGKRPCSSGDDAGKSEGIDPIPAGRSERWCRR